MSRSVFISLVIGGSSASSPPSIEVLPSLSSLGFSSYTTAAMAANIPDLPSVAGQSFCNSGNSSTMKYSGYIPVSAMLIVDRCVKCMVLVLESFSPGHWWIQMMTDAVFAISRIISDIVLLQDSKHCSTSCSVYSDNHPGKTSQYIYAISAISSVHRARRDDLHHWLCPAHPLRLDVQTRSDIYIKS